MRFACRRIVSSIFPETDTVDFVPIIEGVRLLTATGRFAQRAGRERLWPALWDTGAIISVVPRQFVEEFDYQPCGRTRPMRTADGRTTSPEWFYILIGVPGLPLFNARAVAPVDPDPLMPRRHISLGCDIISRLTLRCDSTLPWEIDVAPDTDSSWAWEYERRQ